VDSKQPKFFGSEKGPPANTGRHSILRKRSKRFAVLGSALKERAMSWNDGLTDEQRNAASHAGSHARLLAGPGTGKTFTLARRIVRLFIDLKKPAGSILAFTFTKFAAAELRKRVAAEVEANDKEEKTRTKILPRISTLHSYALRELLRNESRTKLPQPIRISDDWEDEVIIISEMQALMDKSRKDTRQLFGRLSADWQQLSADQKDWERTFPDPKFLGAWREHRQIYGYTMRAELVYQLKTGLEEGDVQIEGPPQHVLVDEFQDLNPCDLAVVGLMAKAGCEIYGAGDDDQSIYGFRYAEPEGIRRFPSEFKPSQELNLIHCKRCDKAILDFALYVARQDPRRIEKTLETDSKEPGQVEILSFADQGEEALGIGKICRWLVNRKGLKPQDILILLRSDRNKVFSTPLSAALLSVGVPVNISSNPLEPLETEPGREFLSLLRLIANQKDDLAWRSILAVRGNGLGESSFRAVYEVARREGIRFTAAVEKVAQEPALIGAKGKIVKTELDAIKDKIKGYSPVPPDKLMEWFQRVAEAEISDTTLRADVLKIFDKPENAGCRSLDELLKAATVSLGRMEQDVPENLASIMTMHQAKGLTAKAVIVAAAEDEYIPGRAQGRFVEDERRLLYVSLTRACHYLFVTYTNKRGGQQRFTGRNSESGDTARHLTTFLSGGPLKPKSGDGFTSGLK